MDVNPQSWDTSILLRGHCSNGMFILVYKISIWQGKKMGFHIVHAGASLFAYTLCGTTFTHKFNKASIEIHVDITANLGITLE